MPYCKEFTDLFSAPQFEVFRKQYSFFDEKDLSETYLENLIKANNFGQASIWLKGLYETYTKRKSGLPFHIGLGNPDARILFVGKELGIDVNYPNPPQLIKSKCNIDKYYELLFVNEAVLNYLLWFCKINGIDIPPNCCFQNPEFPPSFCKLYNSEPKKKSGHYWRYINKAIGAFLERELDFNTEDYDLSFFRYSFLTELNNIPSARTIGQPNRHTIQNKFEDLLNISFFKKFDRVVFSCHTYLRDNISDYRSKIEKAYSVTLKSRSQISCNIKDVYESQQKRVIICNHISGGAGWTNEELQSLGNLLR